MRPILGMVSSIRQKAFTACTKSINAHISENVYDVYECPNISKVSYYRLDKSHETDDESKQNKEVGKAPSAILCVPGTIVKVIHSFISYHQI